MNFKNPFFSIIVPTRERADTLYWTIKTILAQSYEDFELIVSDNCSTDNTKSVIESLADPRIRYVNPGKRLSMSHHWEFALGHTRGEFVTIIGDDDGLFPYSLQLVREIISREEGIDAVVCKDATYIWKNGPKIYKENYLNIPINSSSKGQILKGKEVLKKVLQFEEPYQKLPWLYIGFVATKAIEEVKTKSGGKFFHSMIPDIYSGIAAATVIDKYYYSNISFSIAGSSKHSGGVSHFNPETNQKAADIFLKEENIPFHPSLVLIQSIPVMIFECYLKARELGLLPDGIKCQIERVLEKSIKAASKTSTQNYATIHEAIREIARKNKLQDLAEKLIEKYPLQRNSGRINGIKAIQSAWNDLNKVKMVRCPDEVENIHQAVIYAGKDMATVNAYTFKHKLDSIIKLVKDRL